MGFRETASARCSGASCSTGAGCKRSTRGPETTSVGNLEFDVEVEHPAGAYLSVEQIRLIDDYGPNLKYRVKAEEFPLVNYGNPYGEKLQLLSLDGSSGMRSTFQNLEFGADGGGAMAMFTDSGIGVDDVLFFAETKSSYQGTMLATTMSAMITILSFGLLAFSTTPVIHYFGITVFVGITSAFILAPLAAKRKLENAK